MALGKLIDFFRGYVLLYLEGIHLERFINMAINEQIHLWDFKRLSETTMRLKVSRRGFGKLRHIAYRTRTKVSVCGKYGCFQWKKKAFARKFFVGTSLFGVFLMIFISSLVLDIEVIGNTTVEEMVILEKLSEINLKKGVFRGNIDTDKVSTHLRSGLDNIAWVGITEEGTKVIVEIKERRPAPLIVPMEEPCHIIATKDAVIQQMTVENGEPVVQIGEVVTQGQILISGIVEGERAPTRYLHAMGSVTGKTWHEETMTSKMYEYEKEYTGNTKTKRYLHCLGRSVCLSFPEEVSYYNYDTDARRRIFGFVTWETRVHREYTLHRKELTEEAVKQQAETLLKKRLDQACQKESVISVNVTHTYQENGEMESRLIAECQEQIGETVDFEIQEEETNE